MHQPFKKSKSDKFFSPAFMSLMPSLLGLLPTAAIADEPDPQDLEITLRIRGGSAQLTEILQQLQVHGGVEVVRAVTVSPGEPPSQQQDRIAAAPQFNAPGPYSPRYRGYNDSVGVPLYHDYRLGHSERHGFEDGYRQGRRDGRLITELEQQPYRFGPIYYDAMARAETGMRNGAYVDAARNYLLAAEQYKGDPISRQRAAHALFASGNYTQAVAVLDRAFDLQPKLLYRDYRPSREFASDQVFSEHLALLMQAAQELPAPNERWALLAYLQFAEGRLEEAAVSIKNAPASKSKPKFVGRLRELVSLEPASR